MIGFAILKRQIVKKRKKEQQIGTNRPLREKLHTCIFIHQKKHLSNRLLFQLARHKLRSVA